MRHIAAIVLILGLCLPQALIAGVVLQDSKIDSSKIKVGAYAEVIYGMGERNQVSGTWEKLDTVQGYIKAVDAESLTIGRGFWKEQIAFERIQKLIMAESGREIDRLKETTDTLSVKNNRLKRQQSTDVAPRRIVRKLAGGVLGGGLFALAGGLVGAAMSDCTEDETFCKLGDSLIGGWFGYVVGVPVGINRMDAHDRSTYTLVGSLIGGAASFAVFKMVENETVEKIWPAFVISPLISSIIMSEFFRKPPEARRVSIGLLPGPKGRVSAVATLRF